MKVRVVFHFLLTLVIFSSAAFATPEKPNFILILCDDLGYGDLPSYGNTQLKTPHLDRLAKEGIRFTDFYAAGVQCTPSRAGLLTGRYPVRFGLTYALMTDAAAGIPDAELLLPQALKAQGYSTMLAGKWHLGDQPAHHPLRHGFDHFNGLLRGHDTEPRELWVDDKIVDRTAAVEGLTDRFTRSAEDFIKNSGDRPFFLMLAHTAPHVPLAPSGRFKGKSAAGGYGDAVEEIDDSVGRILKAVEDRGIAEKTYIFFTSDNGPAVDKGKEGGSTGPLRAGKYSTYEGGIRVPFIAWQKARLKPAIIHDPAILLDLMPTLISLAGGKLPKDRTIDGRDLTPLLMGTGPRDGSDLFFYFQDRLLACRSGDWKLKLPEKGDGAAELFDLTKDIGEAHDLAKEQAERVAGMRERMRGFEREAR